MNFTYFPVIPAYYNPYGTAPLTTSNAVSYNGTNETGGGTNYATYSLSANQTLSAQMVLIWMEWHTNYLRIAADEALITANATAITALQAALADLETSSIIYDGTTLTELGLGAGDHPENTVWTALNTKLIAVDAAIAAIVTGVSLATLSATLYRFVSDFTTGLNNTSNTLLVATIASGSASITGQMVTYAGGAINISATQDNYVYLKNDGTLVYKHVNNGAGQPSTDAGTIILWKLVTDGTHVITPTDKRNPAPFTISQLADIYANGAIPFAAHNVDWNDFLLPVTATTGKVLQSDGSDYTEGVLLTIDETNHRLGVIQTSPQTTLDVTGNLRLSDDGTSVTGSIKYTGGTIQRYDGFSWKTLATKTTELSDITLTAIAANDTLYWNGTNWINKQVGFSTVTTGVTGTYVALATDSKIVCHNIAAVTVTIPDPTTCAGRVLDIGGDSDLSANNVIITPVAGLIKGAASLTLSVVGNSAHIWSDGTRWQGIKG